MFRPSKNPSPEQIRDVIASSEHKMARRIQDPRNGDWHYWPFEDATHAEGAHRLAVPYERLPGDGDVVFGDPK